MSSVIERSILNLIVNPEIRTIAAQYLEQWQFEDSWMFSFVSCIRKAEYTGVVPDLNAIILDLHSNYSLSHDDCELAATVLLDYTEPKSIDNSIQHIQEWVKSAYINNGIEIIAAGQDKNFKQKGIDSIKTAVSFQIAVDTFFDFSDPDDIRKAKDEDFPEGSHVIPSSFSLLNKALSYGGLKYGDLIAVAGGTGVGKSSTLVTEGAFHASNGYKVCHVVLGDLTEFDVFIKYLSNYAGVDTDVIIADGWEKYATEEFKQNFKNLRVRALAPDAFDVYQLLAKVDQLYQKFPFQVLIIDYDANIKEAGGSGNSYLEGGVIYANLKGYGKGRCVVYVGSQTKIAHWGEEFVQKAFMNDSSKKQHHLDVMIGIGKSKTCSEVGVLNLPKVRRGKSDVYSYVHFDNAKARVVEIRKEKYDQIIHISNMTREGSLTFDPSVAQ